MSCLKTGISKTVAVLSACGVFAVGGYGFFKIDGKVIAANENISKEITSVVQHESVVTSCITENNSVTLGTTVSIAEKAESKAVSSIASKQEVMASQTVKSEKVSSASKVSTEKTTTTKKSSATKNSEDSGAVTTKKAVTTAKTTSATAKSTTANTTTTIKTTTTQNAATTCQTTTTTQKATTTIATTTTAAATTQPVVTTPVDNGNTPESRLNAATLNVNECLSGNEHTIVKNYLSMIVNDSMTNYEKAVAVYDYLINNTYYAYGGWSKPVQAVLVEGYGTCTEYSYVLAAMMNYLGFEAKTVDGLTAMAAGGYGYHMWVEVTINGQVYVMDAQVDDNLSWGGNISHARFVKTYDEVANKYIKY